jgi:hypothetical protein
MPLLVSVRWPLPLLVPVHMSGPLLKPILYPSGFAICSSLCPAGNITVCKAKFLSVAIGKHFSM